MNRRDLMRGTLATLLLGAFSLSLFVLFKWPVPTENKETLTYMLGQLSGMVTSALAFYFATSKSSAEKTDVIASMADAPATVKIDQPRDEPVPVAPQTGEL